MKKIFLSIIILNKILLSNQIDNYIIIENVKKILEKESIKNSNLKYININLNDKKFIVIESFKYDKSGSSKQIIKIEKQ